MKKVFMSLAIVALMGAAVACNFGTKKAAQEAEEACTEACDSCKAACDSCGTCCDSLAAEVAEAAEAIAE